jgi:predicted enzyme related to lactoylglutathione lyase
MKPTYFDLSVRDIGKARAFFETVLGWQFEKFDMPYDNFRIKAGPENEPGIDGGIGSINDAPLRGCKRNQHLARYAAIEACGRGVLNDDKDTRRNVGPPGASSGAER